jgi:hypothetical protein
LFDELNTQLADQQLAKQDFLRYLRGLPADSRVAVFALGDSLTLLHDFSQDMASLLAAVARHSNRVNPELTASTASPASANSLTGDATTTAQWDSFLQSAAQPYADYAETVRATRTAAALETIAGHVQGIPGRKTLILDFGRVPDSTWFAQRRGQYSAKRPQRAVIPRLHRAEPARRRKGSRRGHWRQRRRKIGRQQPIESVFIELVFTGREYGSLGVAGRGPDLRERRGARHSRIE